MERRDLKVSVLFHELELIRNSEFDPHPDAMHFLGYIAACMHLGAITLSQFSVLAALSDNASSYRSRELRNAL